MADDIGKGDWVQCIRTDPLRQAITEGSTYYCMGLEGPPPLNLSPRGYWECKICGTVNEFHIKLLGVQDAQCPSLLKPLGGSALGAPITSEKVPEHA